MNANKKIKRKRRITVTRKLSLTMTAMIIVIAVISALVSQGIIHQVLLVKEIYDLESMSRAVLSTTDRPESFDALDEALKIYREKGTIDEEKASHLKEAFRGFSDMYSIVEKNCAGFYNIGFCIYDKSIEKMVYLSDRLDHSIGEERNISIKSGTNVVNGEQYYYDLESNFLGGDSKSILATLFLKLDDDDSTEGLYLFVRKNCKYLEYVTIAALIVYMIIFLFFVLIARIIVFETAKNVITRPLKKLSNAAKAFSEAVDKMGDKYYFDNLNIKTNDEVRDLADAMVTMEESLHDYIREFEKATEEKQRISAEIEVAARLQANMLPDGLEIEGMSCDITSFMRPARMVGGDFYDYFRIDEDRVAVVIADVSDKGVPASLFMVVSRTLIMNNIMDNPDHIGDAIRKANIQLCADNRDMMFVTVFAGIYRLSDRSLTYINAGHEDPVIYRKSKGEYSLILEEHDLFMGIEDDIEFTVRKITLDVGDRIFLYTDGVTDVCNESKEFFGTDGIIRSLNSKTALKGQEFIDAFREDIDEFKKNEPQPDDITMVLLEV